MDILMYIFAAFALLGAADRIIGNRFGVGREFEKGIEAMAPLALAMVGMICISPALTNLLLPVIGPVAEFCGFDPSVIAGIVFANDMGGAALAADLAKDPLVGGFNGLIVAAMMGATLSFTIPTALSTIDKSCHKEVLTGILCGISTIPVGSFVSGLMLGIPVATLLINLLPVIVIAALTCVGIAKFPRVCIAVFSILGKLIVALITVGLAAGIFTALTGKTLIPGVGDIADGFAVVAEIAVVLSGVFPLIYVVSKLLARPLSALARKFGMKDASILGFLSTLANSIPTMQMAGDMDPKGRVLNLAFAVSAAFVFGDHLAFTTVFNGDFTPALIVAKLVSGVTAVAVAALVWRAQQKKA